MFALFTPFFFFFFFFPVMHPGLQDLSSPTRAQTRALDTKSADPKFCTAKEFFYSPHLKIFYLFTYFWLCWVFGARFRAWALGFSGSVIKTHRLSCSVACGIFPDQGSNLCSLH